MSTIGKAVFFSVLTLLFTILLGGVQSLGGLPAGVIILPQLAPGLAAWVGMTLEDENLLIRKFFRSQPPWKYAAAGFAPWLIILIELFIFRDILHPRTWFIGFQAVPLPLLVWIGLGAFTEELGWRGYLQPMLLKRGTPLAAALFVGVLWGLWHLGNYPQGVWYVLFFVLSTISYSVVIIWLMEPEGGNLLIPWLVHVGVNFGFLIFDSQLTEVRFMIIHALLWSSGAGLLFLVRRKDFLGGRDLSNPAD